MQHEDNTSTFTLCTSLFQVILVLMFLLHGKVNWQKSLEHTTKRKSNQNIPTPVEILSDFNKNLQLRWRKTVENTFGAGTKKHYYLRAL